MAIDYVSIGLLIKAAFHKLVCSGKMSLRMRWNIIAQHDLFLGIVAFAGGGPGRDRDVIQLTFSHIR